MQPPPSEWSLVLLKQGRPGERIPLAASRPLSIGRDQGNELVIPDSAVSRKHAQIEVTPQGPRLTDLASRHGVKVNGAPRKQCLLQDGDLVEIGAFSLSVVAEKPLNLPTFDRVTWLQLSPAIDQTQEFRIRLPEAIAERQLATLYHVCFWLADGMDEALFTLRCLRLLLDGFQADEIQYYDGEGKLAHSLAAERRKPGVKFAPYLARKMQALSEVTRLPSKTVAKLQERTGEFNYLVAPLRLDPTSTEPVPFLLLLKPTAWSDFTGKDAVLLQAIATLWTRGLARTRELVTIAQENTRLKQKLPVSGLLGESATLRKLREQATRLAATHATILLQGETGSGKEVVAQSIHDQSPRRLAPFIKLNCAAIPEGLIESELFGHARGAFTDAKTDRDGKFQQAHGGTLFLDEIGEMPLSVQAKVLRALESGEVEKIGGKGPAKVDVRVIAATHRDLTAMVKAGRFREDLFYRLNVLGLRVPPLREHVDDLPLLAQNFLDRFCKDNGLAAMSFSSEALTALATHSWPGNVRELRNIIQRCAALAASSTIDATAVKDALAAT